MKKFDENIESNEELSERILTELDSFDTMEEQFVKEKNDDIKSMINYIIKLTDEMEKRRNDIYKNSLQILTISIAAIGLLLSQVHQINIVIFYAIITILFSQSGFSLIIILCYYFQSVYKYTFLDEKKYSNSWKWFYKGNPYIINNPRKLIFKNAKSHIDNSRNYLKGLEFEISKYKEETKKSELKSNLIQYYVLKVHNYYKNQFYLQLADLQKKSIIVLSAILILAPIIYFSIPDNRQENRKMQHVETLWYSIYPSLVEIYTLKNSTTDSISQIILKRNIIEEENKVERELQSLGFSKGEALRIKEKLLSNMNYKE